MKTEQMEISRLDGMTLGRMFLEDPTLQIIEVPMQRSKPLAQENLNMKRGPVDKLKATW